MDPHEEPPKLLTAVEVASLYRVARSTVVSWAEGGLLPHTRTPSGRLRFYRDTVIRMLNEGRPGPSTRPKSEEKDQG
jgi:excisionase family DNA binding protein